MNNSNKHGVKMKFKRIAVIFILSFIVVCLVFCSGSEKQKTTGPKIITLANGLEVILKENHSSPMITSLIFVQAGSKYENRFNNGATHFLEHLLFNGTAVKSMEEIEKGIDRRGGYINAFTSKDFTAYLVTMPKDYIDYGMATQADMLFNSIIPEDKFAKERGIVIEEIRQDHDAEGAAAESFFSERAMAGTPYARSVLGYESIIANLPRQAVIDYYKSFYAPNNMTALIIGDFSSVAMEKTVDEIFGQFDSVSLPAPPEIAYRAIEGRNVLRSSADVKSTYINFSIEAPQYIEKEYIAFTLLEDYLSDSENSPLIKALKSGSDPLVSSISAYLDTKKELTRLNIQIITEKEDKVDSIIAVTDNILASLANGFHSAELLEGYKVSRRCNEIYMSEKLHFYGFTIAPLLAVTGWDYFETFYDRLDSVTVDDITAAARAYLSAPAYIATATVPKALADMDEYVFSGPTEKDVVDYYSGIELPNYNLTAGGEFKYPETKKEITATRDRSVYIKEILDNGLTVVVKANPDSRVFALNVIGKDRSLNEPPGKDGITDFVNRLIAKGTTTRNAEKLTRELSAIGANVTLHDNPWIPYDDRYTTRQFSFMKFETIDRFTETGIELFADMIMNPVFDSVEIEKVRKFLFGQLGRDNGSTYKTARKEFYEALFSGTAYSKSINGNFRTVGSITAEDIKEHHRRMYAPENIIITVGTNGNPEEIMALLKQKFGAMEGGSFTPAEFPSPTSISEIKVVNAPMQKEQVYIYLGHLMPSAASEDAAALKVANAVLSERLRYELREKQSLAYRVGSSVMLDKNFGWFMASIGTGTDNFETARDGILAEVEKLKASPPSEDELELAINSIWGSSLTARLSRINQCYYMGVYEYLGLGYDYDQKIMDQIRQVTADDVRRVAGEYFNTENYVLATAGMI
jgi:predicted Zn-dependent peptidase